MPITVTCACGLELEAPDNLAGQSVKCPECATAVPIPGAASAAESTASAPGPIIEHGTLPAHVREKINASLQEKEHLVWLGRPLVGLVFTRQLGYMLLAIVVVLIAAVFFINFFGGRQPADPQLRKPIVYAAMALFSILGLVFCAIPFYRVWQATQTGYGLTNRRAIIYRGGLFGGDLDHYSPSQLVGMTRANSWVRSGAGDLVFRTVHVVTTTVKSQPTRGLSFGDSRSESVKTYRYGFLAIAQVQDVERLIRETLVDRFVDVIKQAEARLS